MSSNNENNLGVLFAIVMIFMFVIMMWLLSCGPEAVQVQIR